MFRTRCTAVAWLLAYPDTYEIGLPNQGLQILYEILNERDDAVAERTYAPWVDLEADGTISMADLSAKLPLSLGGGHFVPHGNLRGCCCPA